MQNPQRRRPGDPRRRLWESASKAVSRLERRLDEMLADSFPASDPPSFGLAARAASPTFSREFQ